VFLCPKIFFLSIAVTDLIEFFVVSGEILFYLMKTMRVKDNEKGDNSNST